jgi:hypothetical protein
MLTVKSVSGPRRVSQAAKGVSRRLTEVLAGYYDVDEDVDES